MPRRPNILFILGDDLGYGDLGCYGQKEILTPNVDRLAREGVRFTSFYAGSTVCAPSRCCLMTGLHTGHAWTRGNDGPALRGEDRTVAEVLKAAGYATGIVGKWGLGEAGTSGIPNRKGFDYWFGYLNQLLAHNSYPETLWRNEEEVRLDGNVAKGLVSSVKRTFSNDLFTRESLDLLRRNKDTPFFLYHAITIPHANNEAFRAGQDGIEVPSDEPYSDKPWPRVQKNYAAAVTRLDRDLGTILALLKELGLEENTLVIFTSDNGPHKEGGFDPTFFHSSGPLRGIKRDLYEGGIRVPFIARWPGKIRPGTTSDYPGTFWDFLPTASELAGVKPPPGLDGFSILPAMRGEKQPEHEFLYWEFHEGGFFQAVRWGKWKGIRKGLTGKLELYDLSADVGEKRDVSADHPETVARIENYLKTARTESEYWKV